MSEPEIPQSHAREKEEAEIADQSNHGEAQNYSTEDPQMHTQVLPVGNANVARGASWLLWVSGCTLINALCFGFKMDFSLALGLISPAVVSVIFLEAVKGNEVLIFAVSAVPMILTAAFFWFLSKQANLYQTWALIVGFVLILIDSLLSLVQPSLLVLGIHAWALFAIGQGIFACIAANKQYKAQVAQAAAKLK